MTVQDIDDIRKIVAKEIIDLIVVDETISVYEGKTYELGELMEFLEPAVKRNELRAEIRKAIVVRYGVELDD